MTKIILHIIALALLVSCNEFTDEKLNVEDLEYTVIKNTIYDLVPIQPTDLSIVHEYSDNEEINKLRYDSVLTSNQNLIDSLGLEIWLLDELFVPDSMILRIILDGKNEPESLSFSNLKDKAIKDIEFENRSNLRVLKKERFEKMNVNTVGMIRYSRILFSPEMDTAKFIYEFNRANCTDGWIGIVTATFENNRWKIIKNKH